MFERKAPACLSALLFSLGLLAGSDDEGEIVPQEDHVAIQLSDRLDDARIESPLVGLEPAQDIASLSDPALDVLLDEDFEDFDWSYEGWPELPGLGIAPDDGGRVLRIEGISGRPSLGWVLPVQPDAFYRFERAVRVNGVPFCDLYVVESRLELEQARLDVGSQFLAGRGVALKIHGLPIESGRAGDEFRNTWQRADTSFYPTPRTRSLAIVVRPRVGADPGATVRAMSFDDVRLEEVLPSRKERIRLLKGAQLAPDADPALGMRKAGWLLPLPSPEGVREGEAAESNYNWRRALYAPPTTEIAFDLTFPAGARLRLATGLARETPPNAAARFQIEISGPGMSAPEVLLDTVRTARMEDWHWEDVDLDLSAWAGREGTLVLRSLSEKGDPHPLWANPRIEVAGSAADALVILIAVDTLRADHLSSYGYERNTSPALDRLAADGVRFDQARSNCNWTCPSFASIFTGLVPSRHGVSSYGPATPLPDELTTLAEHFQERGWATRSIAYKVPLFDGNYEQGFDEAFNVPRDVIRGEENLARALEWLETHRGGATFLFLHFNDPHQPFVQPEPFDRSFGPSPDDVGVRLPIGVPNPGQDEMIRLFADLYDGAVSYVDSCIGRFLDALRERGLYDTATIAFVADHGEELWERGNFGHGGSRLFDEVVRVPLIVKPPAETFEPGQVITANVSGFDVMPTLLELAGIPPAAELDARSLVPLISGATDSLDRVVVTETSGRGLALVDGGYKFMLSPGGRIEALFHLPSDPLEQNDIASEKPEELARLRALTMAYLLEHRPGNYLLVHGGEEPQRLSISTRAVRTLVAHGVQVEDTSDEQNSYAKLDAGAWALLALEDPDPSSVVITGLESRGSAEEFEPWVAGRLPTLEGAGVWRVRGPEGVVMAVAQTPEEEIDPELLEALQRLGYVE